MFMKKRMLFLDLDGTLLNDAKQITRGNKEALDLALARGHGVIITTGRPLRSAMDQARKLGLDRPGCYLVATTVLRSTIGPGRNRSSNGRCPIRL